MNNQEQSYLDLLSDVFQNGTKKQDRTGTGTISSFGKTLRFDLSKGFPLLTTKKVHFKSIAIELLWFLKGETNIKYLTDNNVKIWNEWADQNGDLQRVYGAQWRTWLAPDGRVVDQISDLVHQLKNNPDSRRHLVIAYNPGEVQNMALPPCHYAFQFYVSGNKLSCMFQMRSSDLFLGLPFNIASYALLTHMLALECGLEVGELIYCGGDCHIYNNLVDQVKEQLTRIPKDFPVLNIKKKANSIFEYDFEDFEIAGYDPHPAIKGKVSV